MIWSPLFLKKWVPTFNIKLMSIFQSKLEDWLSANIIKLHFSFLSHANHRTSFGKRCWKLILKCRYQQHKNQCCQLTAPSTPQLQASLVCAPFPRIFTEVPGSTHSSDPLLDLWAMVCNQESSYPETPPARSLMTEQQEQRCPGHICSAPPHPGLHC